MAPAQSVAAMPAQKITAAVKTVTALRRQSSYSFFLRSCAFKIKYLLKGFLALQPKKWAGPAGSQKKL